MIVRKIKVLKNAEIRNEITSAYVVEGEVLDFPFKTLNEYNYLIKTGTIEPVESHGNFVFPVLEPVDEAQNQLLEQLQLTGNLDKLHTEEVSEKTETNDLPISNEDIKSEE